MSARNFVVFVAVLSVSGWLDTLIVKAVLVLSPKESCAVTVIVLSPICAVVVGVPLNDTVVSAVETLSHPDEDDAGPVPAIL